MKNFLRFTILIPTFMIAACGNESSKDPVQDLQQIREQAKLQGGQGPQAPEPQIKYVPQPVPTVQEKIVYVPKPVPTVQEKIVYVDKPVPTVQEKIVYVPKEVPVVQQQTTLSDNYFKIVMSDKLVSFYEGETGVYQISLRVLDPEIQMKLTAKGLPTGAELKDVSTAKNPNSYELRWKPSFYTISYDEQPPKIFATTLVPVLTSAKSQKKADAVKGLSLEKTITFSVFRTQQKPSELTVNGLGTDIREGQTVPFEVVAKFPGVDNNSPVKPNIAIFKDNTTVVAGSDVLEMDGTRYVSVESVEYIGDYKWKFRLMFDAREVDAQKTKTGALANVDYTQVRFGMRVYGAFNASPATVARVKIARTAVPAQTSAPVVEAPAPVVPKAPTTPKKSSTTTKKPTKPKKAGN